MHISYIYSRQTTDFLKFGLSSHSITDVLKDLAALGGADGASNTGAVRMGEVKTGKRGKNGIWMDFHGLWLVGIHKQS